jgi:hypothetical protein
VQTLNIIFIYQESALIEQLTIGETQRKSLDNQLKTSRVEFQAQKSETLIWQQRHAQLLEQQTKYGPDVFTELQYVTVSILVCRFLEI